jgi:hypothetical protein
MEGFKKLIKFLIVAAIGFGYYYWPKHSIQKFEAALLAGDVEKVKEMIDMDSFKKSAIDEAEEVAVAALKGKRGAPSEEQIRTAVRAEVEKAMGSAAGTDGMVRQMIASAKMNAHKSTMNSGGWPKWHGPFSVSVGEADGDSRAIFGFRGLNGWKLTGMKLGKGDLKKAMAGQL